MTMGVLQFDLTTVEGRERYKKAIEAIEPVAAKDVELKELSQQPAAVALLKFNLDDPDGQEAYRRTAKGLDLALALHDVSEEISRRYNAEMITDEEREAFEKFGDFFVQVLEDRGIFFDDILS